MIKTHHDGQGLNESIVITSDKADPNAGNAPHNYRLAIDGKECGSIQFRHGPRHVEGSTPGATHEALLAVIIDRYEGFQSGEFACKSNRATLKLLRCTMASMKRRTSDRLKRGVLGKNLQ